jgi:rhodanese-related sulfurtransferase
MKSLAPTFSAFLLFAILSCNAQTATNIKVVDPVSFKKEISTTPNAQILDVRTAEEFTVEHLQNAENVNWYSPDFSTNTTKYDTSKPVFIYCRSGKRSHLAAEKLVELGFTTIIEMEGGIINWTTKGLTTTAEKKQL